MVTLSIHIRQALEHLTKGNPNPPIGRFFWHLTRDGIRYVSLPPKVWSPAALGFRRVWLRGPSLYNPTNLRALKRVRIWVSQEATAYQIEEWLKPYRPKGRFELIELNVRTYELRRKRCVIYDYIVRPEIENDLDRVIKKMNSLPYNGVWSVLKIDGGKAILFERRAVPSIVLKLNGVFYGSKGEKFHMRRMEQAAASMLSMLAKYFPEHVRFYRESSRIPNSRA